MSIPTPGGQFLGFQPGLPSPAAVDTWGEKQQVAAFLPLVDMKASACYIVAWHLQGATLRLQCHPLPPVCHCCWLHSSFLLCPHRWQQWDPHPWHKLPTTPVSPQRGPSVLVRVRSWLCEDCGQAGSTHGTRLAWRRPGARRCPQAWVATGAWALSLGPAVRGRAGLGSQAACVLRERSCPM